MKFALLFVLLFAASSFGQTAVRPIVLNISGACDAGEMSVEYFLAGKFGGYGDFIPTVSGQNRYRIPDSFEGKPAGTLKLIIRGPRCRTQLYDFPEIGPKGLRIDARLKRAKSVEFRGVAETSRLGGGKHWLTVEYWAHWKCEFLGVIDCLLGPNRVDAVEVRRDGRFKVRVPDYSGDPVLDRFANRGAFQFFIRDRKTGNILYNLDRTGDGPTHEIVVSGAYPAENFFVPRAAK